ncbi:MAG: glycosyltransferase [Acidobacteriota bacterium]|nr:glycosyltransferase [Acidobacteriota bacterium]
MAITNYVVLALAAIPFIYYLLVLFCTADYFRAAKKQVRSNADFTPGVSILKPVKGLDITAYENYASFCRLDYPEYEIVFCVDGDDPSLPVIEKLRRDFPERQIRVLAGSGRNAINDKVARLVRLTHEAKYDLFVIADSDVRVRPDYLRTVVAPFRDERVGAATCLYASAGARTLAERLQSIGMISDFFASVMVAWKLDGVKFTLGQTIVTTREAVESWGGYPVLEDRPADDLYAGKLAAEQGYEVKLLPYVVDAVADFGSMGELLHKRVRWATVQRWMRPWGHMGLIFTFGLPWAIAAAVTVPTAPVIEGYFGGYAACRIAMAALIGGWGMKQRAIWKKIPLIPLWDLTAFAIWLASFTRRTVRWRGVDYLMREGKFVSATPAGAKGAPIDPEKAADA